MSYTIFAFHFASAGFNSSMIMGCVQVPNIIFLAEPVGKALLTVFRV